MKPDRWQQLVAALSVSLVVASTIAAGFLLSLGEGGLRLSGVAPTATPFVIPTIGEPVPTGVRPDEEEFMPVTPSDDEPTETPTPTVTVTITTTATEHLPTPVPCVVQAGWQAYTVQAGETLAAISKNYGLSANDIQAGSCLDNQSVRSGDVVYVPPATPTLTPPSQDVAELQPTGTQTATDGACTNPDSVIALPSVGETLSGTVQFLGTARLPDFGFYKLEIRPESYSAEDYVTFFTSEVPILSDVLVEFDTRAFDNGSYWIRLVVVSQTGNYPERCANLYEIQN